MAGVDRPTLILVTMKLEGTQHIAASREKVYAYFTDANFVSQCAPGVEKLEELEPGKKFRIVVGVGFGAIKATFNTDVEFVEKRLNEYARIKAIGKAPGSGANVSADLTLSATSASTTDLHWVADVSINGAIALVANRLMGSVAQKLSGEFFACAQGKIESAE